MDSCIFCKIIKREIPASIVYEDERVLAFNDIAPVAPVHVLVIPKMHIPDINGINAENASVLADIHLAVKEIAAKLGIADSGFRLISNCGADAGQTVHHLHFHMLGGKSLGTKII